MAGANRHLEQIYRAAHNREFGIPISLSGSACVPFINGNLPDILCEQHERTIGNDNCVSVEGLSLQIHADELRCHCVRARVQVHRYVHGTLALFHGPRKLRPSQLCSHRNPINIERTNYLLPNRTGLLTAGRSWASASR
ncbi:MAG: hypothetical protein ABIR55_00435 [Burkholderiaceae bacterium]